MTERNRFWKSHKENKFLWYSWDEDWLIYTQSSNSVRVDFTSRLPAIPLMLSTEADLQRDRKNFWSSYKHLKHSAAGYNGIQHWLWK